VYADTRDPMADGRGLRASERGIRWAYSGFCKWTSQKTQKANFALPKISKIGGLCLLSDYGDRAMGVADNSIRDTAQQSPP
jgi:hypothetical protein